MLIDKVISKIISLIMNFNNLIIIKKIIIKKLNVLKSEYYKVEVQ